MQNIVTVTHTDNFVGLTVNALNAWMKIQGTTCKTSIKIRAVNAQNLGVWRTTVNVSKKDKFVDKDALVWIVKIVPQINIDFNINISKLKIRLITIRDAKYHQFASRNSRH